MWQTISLAFTTTLLMFSICFMLFSIRMPITSRHWRAMINAFFALETRIWRQQIQEGDYDEYVSIGNKLCEKYTLNSDYRWRHAWRVAFFMNPWKIYPPNIAYIARKQLGYDDRWHRSAHEKSRYYAWKHIAKGRAFVPGYTRPGGHTIMLGYSPRHFGKPSGLVRWSSF